MRTVTTSEWIASWIDIRANRKKLAPSTVSGYKTILRRHIAPQIGDVPLNELATTHVSLCISSVLGKGYERTAQLVYVVLSASMAYAVEKGVLSVSPVSRDDRPFHHSEFTGWWNAEEVARFVAANADDPFLPAWLLALTCGLRRGELLGLQWRDIDQAQMVLRVRRQRILVDGVVYERPPKSKAGIRDIPLTAELLDVLKEHRRRQMRVRPSKYVLADANGAPISARRISLRHHAAIKRADVHYIPLHGMRHTMASLAAASGVPIKVMQGILGHATFKVTADIYTHVDDSQRRRAVSQITQFVIAV